jgi:hypothetical protein
MQCCLPQELNGHQHLCATVTTCVCLPSALAAPPCPVSALPALPPNAAWTPDNDCTVDGGTVVERTLCTADCVPGLIKSGSLSYVCRFVSGSSPFWSAIATDLTCTGESCTCAAGIAPKHVLPLHWHLQHVGNNVNVGPLHLLHPATCD